MAEEKTENTMTPEQTSAEKGTNSKKSNNKIPLIIAAVCLVLAGLIWLFVWLDAETTGRIRDTMLVIYVIETSFYITFNKPPHTVKLVF